MKGFRFQPGDIVLDIPNQRLVRVIKATGELASNSMKFWYDVEGHCKPVHVEHGHSVLEYIGLAQGCYGMPEDCLIEATDLARILFQDD